MRLDKFLKESRLIKRRTIAKEACDQGRVLINDKVSKSGSEVKEGDVITVKLGGNEYKVEVVSTEEGFRKEDAINMYKKI